MRKIRNALLSILTVMFGANLAVPTEAAERLSRQKSPPRECHGPED